MMMIVKSQNVSPRTKRGSFNRLGTWIFHFVRNDKLGPAVLMPFSSATPVFYEKRRNLSQELWLDLLLRPRAHRCHQLMCSGPEGLGRRDAWWCLTLCAKRRTGN